MTEGIELVTLRLRAQRLSIQPPANAILYFYFILH